MSNNRDSKGGQKPSRKQTTPRNQTFAPEKHNFTLFLNRKDIPTWDATHTPQKNVCFFCFYQNICVIFSWKNTKKNTVYFCIVSSKNFNEQTG